MISTDGAVIYDNTEESLGRFFKEHREYGDQVDLEGDARLLTQILFEYFGEFEADGDEQVKVRVYTNEKQYDRYRKAPTTLLFESDWISIEPGYGTRAVSGLNLRIPYETITVTFKFDGLGTNETAGLLFYGPPTVGYSFNEVWMLGDTGKWVPVLYSTADPTLRANAAMRLVAEAELRPEPAQTNRTSVVALREGSAETRIAQTFTATASGRLVEVMVAAQFTNSAFMAVRILDAAGEGPGPTVLGTRFMTQGTGERHTLNYAEEAIYVKAGHRYAIELSTTARAEGDRDYLAAVAQDVYADGQLWQRDEAGGTWSALTGENGTGLDLFFEARVIPSDPPVELSGVRRRQIFDFGETIFLNADVEVPGNWQVARVRFMAGAGEIGVLTNAPYAFAWTNAPAGQHQVRAIAEDEFNRPFRSDSKVIEVRAPGAPENDHFAARAVVNGFSARVVKPAALATLDPGEPRPAAGYSGKTLWWSWTAPDDTPVTVSAQNSSEPETSVAVYSGNELGRLVLVTNGIPQVRFAPEPGRRYEIVVEPRVAASHVAMELAPALRLELPANVVRATDPLLLRLTGSETRNITNVQVMVASQVLWRTNKAPASVTHRFNTSGIFNLVTIATDNRGIRTISSQPLIVRPANDDVRNATVLTGFAARAAISSVAATRESIDPIHFGTATHSLWYRWSAPADGMGVVETTERPAGSAMAVYRALEGDALFEGLTLARTEGSQLEFFARGGEAYLIFLVANQAEEGTLDFRFEPANDSFARRGLLKGVQDERVFRLIGGSLEMNEPHVPGFASSRSSAWWSWTAPASGTARMESSFAGRLEVFTGSSLDALEMVAGGAFHVSFTAEESKVYQIRVWGRNDDAAEGRIAIEMQGLRITRPVQGQVFGWPAQIPLKAVEVGGVAGGEIEFLANGEVLTNTVASGTTKTWTPEQRGTYELRARSRFDTSIVSAPVFITCDTNHALFQTRIYSGAFARGSMISDVTGRLRVFGARPAGLARAEHNDPFHPALLYTPASSTGWKSVAMAPFAHLFVEDALLNRRLYSNTTVVPIPPINGSWLDVSAGSNHFVAVMSNGELYINGTLRGEDPQVGEKWLDARFSAHEILGLSTAWHLYLLDGETGEVKRPVSRPVEVERWTQIDAGHVVALALGSNGEIYTLNLAAATPAAAEPVRVTRPAGMQSWRALAAGGEHQLMLGENGVLYAMGRNAEGQLGIGETNAVKGLQRVPFPAGVSRWTQIAAGELHSMAIGDDCRLYAWGSNAEGQLGLGRHVANAARAMPVDGVGEICLPGPARIKAMEVATDGRVTFSFNTILNRWMFIEHSSDLRDWQRAEGIVFGDGFETEWTDMGAPGTVQELGGTARFYRVVRE